jgi:hypothetical protein
MALRFLLTFSISICTLLAYLPVYGVFISLSHYTREAQNIALIGEAHCDFEYNLTDTFVVTDKTHARLLYKWLDQWKSSGKKIAFLLESSKDFVECLQPKLLFAQENPSIIHAGMHITLPYFAYTRNYIYGAIKFIDFDLRPAEIIEIINFFNVLDGMSNTQDATFFNDRNKKKFLFGQLPGYTVDDFLTKLEARAEIAKSLSHDYYNRIINYKKSAEDFFGAYSSDQKVAECLWSAAEQKGVHFINEAFAEWIQPLSSLIADIGLQLELVKTLKEYDTIIIFGGLRHIKQAALTLSALSFEKKLCYEPQEELNPSLIRTQYHRSTQEIEHFFTSYTAASSLKDTKSPSLCAQCQEPNCTQRCGNCKTLYYCSKSCQTTHWPIHKLFCSKQ